MAQLPQHEPVPIDLAFFVPLGLDGKAPVDHGELDILVGIDAGQLGPHDQRAVLPVLVDLIISSIAHGGANITGSGYGHDEAGWTDPPSVLTGWQLPLSAILRARRPAELR